MIATEPCSGVARSKAEKLVTKLEEVKRKAADGQHPTDEKLEKIKKGAPALGKLM